MRASTSHSVGGRHAPDPPILAVRRAAAGARRAVPRHPRRPGANAGADDPARRRTGAGGGGDRAHRPAGRGDGAALVRALRGRGRRGLGGRTAIGASAEGDHGVPRTAARPRTLPPPGARPAVLAVDRGAPGRPPGRTDRGPHQRGERRSSAARGRDAPEPAAAHHHQPRPRVRAEQGAVEAARGGLKPGETFYYADEFNISGHPTIRAMWSPVGRQAMIPTPAQPTRRYGVGAVDWHSGEAGVLTRRHKGGPEVAEPLQELLARHPRGPIHVAWDSASTHEDGEVEAVRAARRRRTARPPMPAA